MFNLSQLQEMLSNKKANLALARMRDLFPADAEIIPEKVIRHDASRMVLNMVKDAPKQKNIDKFIQEKYLDLLDICNCDAQKSVCAKLITNGDTIAECLDCQADPSCIICMDCFKNGNHKGHKVYFRKGCGGCCDCGDHEAWKEEGFCSNHTGQTQDVSVEQMEINFSNELLSELYYLFVYSKLVNPGGMNPYFKYFLKTLKEMIQRGIKGVKLIYYFLQEQMPKHLTVSTKLKGTVLQQLLNANFTSREETQSLDNLFIELFPYYPFKKLLLSEYIRCYSSVYAGESTKGMSIACQIMTSYKLIEEYCQSQNAVPITIEPNLKCSQARHLTKMMTYDLERISKLTQNVPLKYWTMLIKFGIKGLFGYYESLKMAARKEKKAAEEAKHTKTQKSKKAKKKKQKKSIIDNLLSTFTNVEEVEDEERDDTNFDEKQFLIRQNKGIECEHYVLDELLKILPVIAQDNQLLLELIRSIFVILMEEVKKGDDLIIFRPYERLLGIALFFYVNQNPFLLLDEKIRETFRVSVGVNHHEWKYGLNALLKRMLETFGFFSHMQTCQTSGYQTSFYAYLILYSNKYHLLGNSDILIIKELILLGASHVKIDFDSIAKIKYLEKPDVWTLAAFSGIVNELGLLYTGYFTQIFMSFYTEKANPPVWIQEQAKQVLKKFITEEGGSASFEKIIQFSSNFLFENDDHLKKILKELCSFNKEKKTFTLLAQNTDKNPINFSDFRLRSKLQNKQSAELPHPQLTLQLIKSNKTIFTALWNEENLNSFCQILLKLHDDVVSNKSKDQLVEFYALPCKIQYLLNSLEIPQERFSTLSQILFNFDVPNEIRKILGPLSNSLSPILEEQLSSNSSNDQFKEDMKKKKLKKLEELKKKKVENLQKIKEKHQLTTMETQPCQNEGNEECVICRKSGGNLVWIAKMSIRNLQKLLKTGPGALTLSFTSCYHTFDEECLTKSSIKRSTHEYLFRCPLCRTLGNVFFNLNGSYQSSFDRIMHVAMTMREYATFNIHEELLKSFYHYILLGYLEPSYIQQKRLKLYQKILAILSSPPLRKDMLELQSKLNRHKINLEPKLLAAGKQKINLHQLDVEEEDFFDQQEDDEDEERLFFDTFLQNQRQTQMKINEAKKKKAFAKLEKKQKQKGKEFINDQTPIFYSTCKRILSHILRENEEFKMEAQVVKEQKAKEEQILGEEEQNYQKQIEAKLQQLQSYEPEPWLGSLLDELLNEKNQMTVEWTPPKLLKIIELPQKYYWDMSEGTCDSCGIVCQDLFICLLCKWKGCLNTCKKNGIKGHNKKAHGQSGAFLRLKDASSYMIGPGQLSKIGCLYTNEWGQEFKQDGDWNLYHLQREICEKVVDMMLKNE